MFPFVEVVLRDMTWEKFIVALFTLSVGMYARSQWWRMRREMRRWE